MPPKAADIPQSHNFRTGTQCLLWICEARLRTAAFTPSSYEQSHLLLFRLCRSLYSPNLPVYASVLLSILAELVGPRPKISILQKHAGQKGRQNAYHSNRNPGDAGFHHGSDEEPFPLVFRQKQEHLQVLQLYHPYIAIATPFLNTLNPDLMNNTPSP